MPRRILSALFNNEQEIDAQFSHDAEQRQYDHLNQFTAVMYGQSQAKPAVEKTNNQTSDLKNDTDDMARRTEKLNINDEPAIHGQSASPAAHDNVCNEVTADKKHPMLNHVQEPELHGERPATGSADNLNIQTQQSGGASGNNDLSFDNLKGHLGAGITHHDLTSPTEEIPSSGIDRQMEQQQKQEQQRPQAISTQNNMRSTAAPTSPMGATAMSPTSAYNARGSAINQAPLSPTSSAYNEGQTPVATHLTETGFNDLSNAYRKNQAITEDDDQFNDINEVYRGNAQGGQPTDVLSDTSSATSADLQQPNDIRGVYRTQARVLKNSNPNILAGGAGVPQYNNMSDVYRSGGNNFSSPPPATPIDDGGSSSSSEKGFKETMKGIFGRRRKSNASSSSSEDEAEDVDRVHSSRGKRPLQTEGRQPAAPNAPSMMGNSDAELFKQQMQQRDQFARMPNAENLQPAGTRNIGDDAEANFVKQQQHI